MDWGYRGSWTGIFLSRAQDVVSSRPRWFAASFACCTRAAEHLSDIRRHADDEVLLRLSGLRKFPAPNSLTERLRNSERMVNYGDVSRRENVVLHGLEDVNRDLLGILARKLKRTGFDPRLSVISCYDLHPQELRLISIAALKGRYVNSPV